MDTKATDTQIEQVTPLVYPLRIAAEVSGRSESTLRRAIRSEQLTARKAGKSTLVERAELQRWIATWPTIGRPSESLAA